MIDIPDAPWIRDAELNGVPDTDYEFTCPICGAVTPDAIYLDIDKQIVGCDCCVKRIHGWEYVRNGE